MTGVSRVVSFGCSMTFGQELPDCDPTTGSPTSYAGIIASKFDLPYVCLAAPGAGNDKIFRTVMEFARTNMNDDDFIIIGWSMLHRREYYSQPHHSYMSMVPSATVADYDCWYGKLVNNEWNSDALNHYQWFLANTPEDVMFNDYINLAVALAGYLRSRGIKFIMLQALWEIQDYQSLITELINMPEYYSDISFISKMFLDNIHLYPCNHPKPLGHQIWADIILKWMNT